MVIHQRVMIHLIPTTAIKDLAVKTLSATVILATVFQRATALINFSCCLAYIYLSYIASHAVCIYVLYIFVQFLTMIYYYYWALTGGEFKH